MFGGAWLTWLELARFCNIPIDLVEHFKDILKHGKRFHATVSFDTDTGLKDALAKVNDYSPLMKDFPLNELFAATEIEKVRCTKFVIVL